MVCRSFEARWERRGERNVTLMCRGKGGKGGKREKKGKKKRKKGKKEKRKKGKKEKKTHEFFNMIHVRVPTVGKRMIW